MSAFSTWPEHAPGLPESAALSDSGVVELARLSGGFEDITNVKCSRNLGSMTAAVSAFTGAHGLHGLVRVVDWARVRISAGGVDVVRGL